MKLRRRLLKAAVMCWIAAISLLAFNRPVCGAAIASLPSTWSIVVNAGMLPRTEALPYLEAGRIYVPARAFFSAVGADSIEWRDRSMVVMLGKNTFRIPVGQVLIEVNRVQAGMESPAIIRNSRTYVPVRTITRALGGTTVWDPATRTCSVFLPDLKIPLPGAKGILSVSFIDVGQGEAILFDLDGTDLLIDGGPDLTGNKVVQYLKSRGVEKLDFVIATHSHEDHINGLPAVFDAFDVKAYLDNGVPSTTPIYKRLESKVLAEGCMRFEEGNQTLHFGALSIEIIETVDQAEDLNDTSVAALITYGREKILLAGDAGYAVDPYLVKVGRVDLYKAEHHGSWTGNSTALLSVLQPAFSVVCYDPANPFGLPSPEVMATLWKYSKQVLWTAGKTVVITTDGLVMNVQ
jgi:beta-lactamase superfamily II metal-dependent hydrolase